MGYQLTFIIEDIDYEYITIDLVNDEGGRTISGVSLSFLDAIEGDQGYIKGTQKSWAE